MPDTFDVRHFLICSPAMFIIEKVCIRADTSIMRTRTIPKNESEFLFKKEKCKRPGQRRMAWSAPTEIKETRRAPAIRC
ncbi:hypothetical protein COJ96_03260 [Bacillus sp. AFS073361]|nr:hypothetical protein COJ96_03260 [Bacillus sp. AFS073361]